MEIIANIVLFLATITQKLSNSLIRLESNIRSSSKKPQKTPKRLEEYGLPCGYTGQCKPYYSDEDDSEADISNCRFCGSELHKVDGVWKNWDWDLHK